MIESLRPINACGVDTWKESHTEQSSFNLDLLICLISHEVNKSQTQFSLLGSTDANLCANSIKKPVTIIQKTPSVVLKVRFQACNSSLTWKPVRNADYWAPPWPTEQRLWGQGHLFEQALQVTLMLFGMWEPLYSIENRSSSSISTVFLFVGY